MVKMVCAFCKHHDVYENEKHAYMAGWNWVGPYRKTTICWECEKNPPQKDSPEYVKTNMETND